MKTVVWDVDDVLNDLMHQWFHLGWLREHPECKVAYSELANNPPHESLGVDRAAYLASMDAFRKTEHAASMSPNAEILAWFREEGHRFRHIALTARPLETAPDVAYWVMRHFGAWIRCFGVVPTRSDVGVPVYDGSKGDFLKWIGKGDALVDDHDENIRQAAKLGLKTLQVAQPWNRSSLTLSAILQQLSEWARNN
jgi:hypothetical protein